MSSLGPQTAALASVNASATTVVLFAATANARGRVIQNDGSTPLFVAFAATATATAYTVQIAAGASYTFADSCYSGVVSGIWSGSPTGAARLTSW